MPSFRGSSQPRNQTHISRISCNAGRFVITEPPGIPASFTAPGLRAPDARRFPDRTAEGSWDLLCNSRLLPILGPDSAPSSRLFPLEAIIPGGLAGRAGRRARPPPPREPSLRNSVWLLYKYLSLYTGFFPPQPDFFLSFIC